MYDSKLETPTGNMLFMAHQIHINGAGKARAEQRLPFPGCRCPASLCPWDHLLPGSPARLPTGPTLITTCPGRVST